MNIAVAIDKPDDNVNMAILSADGSEQTGSRKAIRLHVSN
jgi:hypothetical protein